MSSHLIDTSDEDDCVVAVIVFLSDLLDEGKSRTALADTAGSAFTQQCRESLQQEDFEAVLEKIIEQLPLLFTKGSPSDVEAALAVCNHLLLTGLPIEQQPVYLQKLAAGVTVKEGGNNEQRLSALTELFNSAKEPKLKYEILLQGIAFAKATSQTTILAPGIRSNIDSWVKDWQLDPSEQQTLYLAIADLFRANKKRKALIKEAYKLTVRALANMQDLGTTEPAVLKTIAVSAVSEFIASPEVFNFDLMTSPAIQQLENDGQYGPLHKLLSLVLDGDVKGLDSFLEANTSILEAVNTTAADVKSKTRLMALLGLAAADRRIDYSIIQDRLGVVDSEEVEDWLVKAMGRKLLSGQMDQMKQQVTITKASYRMFGPEDWQHLEKQLAAWRTNVEKVHDMVDSSDVANRQQMSRPQANGVHAQ